MPDIGYVYIAKNKVDGKVYVGQTINFSYRLKQHLRADPRSKSYFENVLQKYGKARFDFIVMPYPVAWLDFWEAYWISSLRSLRPLGYNCTEGGGGIRGHRHSEETKKKLALFHTGMRASAQTKARMSRAQRLRFNAPGARESLSVQRRGESNNFFGKHHSEETRKKIAESRKHLTDAMRRNISAGQIGRRPSPETRAKMSRSLMGNQRCVGTVASAETRKRMSEAQCRRYALARATP
jgi:group I intron endonuclease